jgi:hypothetical protein
LFTKEGARLVISGGLVPLADHWQEILRINLIRPFLAIKYAMPHMIA